MEVADGVAVEVGEDDAGAEAAAEAETDRDAVREAEEVALAVAAAEAVADAVAEVVAEVVAEAVAVDEAEEVAEAVADAVAEAEALAEAEVATASTLITNVAVVARGATPSTPLSSTETCTTRGAGLSSRWPGTSMSCPLTEFIAK